MAKDTVHALHPNPDKQGVTINRGKYEQMRTAIEDSLREAVLPLTFMELSSEVRDRLGEGFDGSVSWYLVTVKLDLEARGVIERVPNTRVQQLRLVDPKGEADAEAATVTTEK